MRLSAGSSPTSRSTFLNTSYRLMVGMISRSTARIAGSKKVALRPPCTYSSQPDESTTFGLLLGRACRDDPRITAITGDRRRARYRFQRQAVIRAARAADEPAPGVADSDIRAPEGAGRDECQEQSVRRAESQPDIWAIR